MITTVTTTTVTTANTVAGGTFALIVILILLALLINKEIISGLTGERAQRVSRALNIAIIPLATVFLATFAIRLADTLR